MDLACIATNFTITVVPGTNAPVIMLNYPQNGMIICGSSFTIDGWLDNPTAGLMVTIVDTNGVTNAFSGLVERSGFVWAQTLAVTNQYMSTSQAPVSLNVSQGMACALAVQVDDTNLADATWTPYSASVTGNLVFTNGNPSRPFSSQGEFNMFRPKAKITTTTRAVIVASRLGSPTLSFGLPLPNQQGILFTATILVPDGFSGSYEWAQIVNNSQATRQRASDLKYDRYHSAGLDSVFPYGSDPPDNPLQTTDSPDYGLLGGFLEYNALTDEFEMWFMFQPNPVGSHLVPLRAVNWNWSGSATNTLNGWVLESGTGTNSVNPSDFDAETYPYWTDNVTNQNIWITGQ